MQNKTAVIDICGTLFGSNTTFDFLDYSIHTRRYIIFRKISKSYPWRFLNKSIRRTTGKDLTRMMALKVLKGKSYRELHDAAVNFYDSFLVGKIHKPVQDTVNRLKQDGYTLCLASATLDCIAEVVSQKWDIELCCSSSLGYCNSVCTGRLKIDLLAKKTEYLKQEGLFPPYGITLTDDFTDIGLIRNSEASVIVSDRKKAKKWIKELKKQQVADYRFIVLE